MVFGYSTRKCLSKYICILTIFTVFLLVFVINIFPYSRKYAKQNAVNCVPKTIIQTVHPNLPIVKVYGIQEGDTKLDIVKSIFVKIGYKIDISNTSDWEILWSYTYPFYSLRHEFHNLKHYQKINHFPGSGYITQKNNLVSLPVHHIPKSFSLPAQKEEFIKYAEKNKHIFWVMKNSNHRGIRILNGTENLNVEGSFVQEFIKNPLLINGKKFDIGVYVIMTSIDPLRVYMYSGDILLRFCTKNYFPLNINYVESYVVGDDYLPIWEVPDLKFYYSELNYTAKESLNAYLQVKGKSTRRLWSDISKIIQDVYFSVEEEIKRQAMTLGSLRNYFELVRFDFVADESMNVYLLEVNMSPNLSPAHFSQNSLLYEQIIFNSLQIVGLVRKFHHVFFYRGETEVSEKDIQVNARQCSSLTCQQSCKIYKCKVCNQCMDRELREVFKSAYLEFMNRGKYSRVIPISAPAKESSTSYKKTRELSLMNVCMDMWFKGKCLQDSTWC